MKPADTEDVDSNMRRESPSPSQNIRVEFVPEIASAHSPVLDSLVEERRKVIFRSHTHIHVYIKHDI